MNIARLCSDLVSIRSENPPGDTRDVIEFIRGFTDSLGISTTVIRGPGGRDNLVSQSVKGNLLFCGHVDVVPALSEGWDDDPFSGRIAEGSIFGRGTTDMKGGCASILWACRTLIEEGSDLPADLAFVCDEETSGQYGIRRLLSRNLLVPCDCIIAEPTPPLNPNIGQKGLMRLRLTFTGEPGHGSLYPVRGVSAIMEAYSLLRFLGELHQTEYHADDPELAGLIHESSAILRDLLHMDEAEVVLTRLMFNPGMIEGGEKANIIAQRCTLELDLRIPWGCSLTGLLDTIRAHAPRAEVSVMGSMSAPSITPRHSRIVSRLLEEIGKVQGSPAAPIVQWAASDARFLRKEGFSVVEYGPGEIPALHAINEYVTIESLENAALVYQGMMEQYAGDSQS
jgi:succinyl-diaminopimelate desuccinylase